MYKIYICNKFLLLYKKKNFNIQQKVKNYNYLYHENINNCYFLDNKRKLFHVKSNWSRDDDVLLFKRVKLHLLKWIGSSKVCLNVKTSWFKIGFAKVSNDLFETAVYSVFWTYRNPKDVKRSVIHRKIPKNDKIALKNSSY